MAQNFKRSTQTFTAPSRLQLAREFRGITRKALAEDIGCTPMNISGYEKGNWLPSDDMIKEISRCLKFPTDWFLQSDLPLVNPRHLTFRARSSMTATTRGQASRAWDISGVLATHLISRFNLPTVAIPDLAGEEPEHAAQILREEWRIGKVPIPNMIHLLESKGVMIFWNHLEGSGVDAYCNCHEQIPILMLNSHVKAGERVRFNIAHELGHLVLHRENSNRSTFAQDASFAKYAGANDPQANGEEKKTGRNKQEEEANRFASSFLVPQAAWVQESPVTSIPQAFLKGKVKWRTSMQMLVRRSYDLKMITEWQYEHLMKQISILGWRKKEPNQFIPESSLLHSKIGQLLQRKHQSIEDFAEVLHLPVAIIQELMPELEHACILDTTSNTYKAKVIQFPSQ